MIEPPESPSSEHAVIETFWQTHCHACAHDNHPLSRCTEIVGGYPEPDYCPCSVEMAAMEAEIRRLRSLVEAL